MEVVGALGERISESERGRRSEDGVGFDRSVLPSWRG